MRRRYCSTAVLMIAGVFVVLAAVAGFKVGFASEKVQAKYYTDTTGTAKEKIVTLNVSMPHYTVHFEANGGVSGSMEDQDFEFNKAQNLSPNGFRWIDHTFIGWNTAADGSGDAYDNGEEVLNLTSDPFTVDTVTLYAQWEAGMQTVFSHDGACTFGGANGITGTECADYAGQTYIDTGVQLYNEENYERDYEIGFTIVYYNQASNVDQATFMNTKWENEAADYPGLTVRKGASNRIEFTQKINHVKVQAYHTISNGIAENLDIVVTRLDGVVYYSVNGGNLHVLQSIVGTADYIPDEEMITVWFGAAPNTDRTPFRVINGTMSNMYVKLGDPKVRYRVDFDAQGGVVNPAFKYVYEMRTLGTLPEVTWTDAANTHYFNGWYTEPNGGGQRVTPETIVNGNMTVYAFWSSDNNVCEVNGVGKETLQECVDAAGTTPMTVIVTKDTSENVTVSQGQDITFDLGDHVMSDNRSVNAPVIDNNGIVRISHGLLTSGQARSAVINNEQTGWLYVSGDTRVIATGDRQAIYNYGGHTVISDDVYMSSASSARATVHNLNNGVMTILGGTIVSSTQQGVSNERGTLTIGQADGMINSVPVIRGATYGITTTANISVYDGVFMGINGAIDNESRITNIESGASAVHGTEVIDGATYNTLYYTK